MNALKIIGISIGSFMATIFLALLVIGSLAPETYIYNGRQIPGKFMREIRSLDLLNKNEHIKYFYTDGFMDIKDGFYLVTDSHLIVYSNEWEEPASKIPFDEIVALSVEYDDSFFNDTMVTVETSSEMEITFPISSDMGRDKLFVKYLKEKTDL